MPAVARVRRVTAIGSPPANTVLPEATEYKSLTGGERQPHAE